jgi:hypothetical protein
VAHGIPAETGAMSDGGCAPTWAAERSSTRVLESQLEAMQTGVENALMHAIGWGLFMLRNGQPRRRAASAS